MNIYTPNYYHKFHCIASSCKHNCCIGWEIDIDDETLEKYSEVGGDFSKRLHENISTQGIPHFILAEGERCPFLNEKNLCDIITELGEDHLCQICSDHPRFRNFFTGRTEMGLGLCCEEAARMILTEDEPFYLASEDIIDDEDMTEAEMTFFQIRNTLFDILTDRNKSLSERMDTVLDHMGISSCELISYDWAEEFSQLEILDETWKEYIGKLALYEDNGEFPLSEYETSFENLMIYFLYRHLAGSLEDGCLNERVAFAYISVLSIYRISSVIHSESGTFSMEDLVEIARMYSSEVEYSEENTEHLLDILFEIV